AWTLPGHAVPQAWSQSRHQLPGSAKMRRALFLSALVLAACSSQEETPKTSLPTVRESPAIEDRVLVCQANDDTASTAVGRCVTSLDGDALVDTITRWGQAQPFWSDVLFNTGSFVQRYPLRDTERECVRRALCQPMPFEGP